MAENQFTEVSPEYWQKRWEERKIGFHRSHVDSYVSSLYILHSIVKVMCFSFL